MSRNGKSKHGTLSRFPKYLCVDCSIELHVYVNYNLLNFLITPAFELKRVVKYLFLR